jgi:hypothetical protein
MDAALSTVDRDGLTAADWAAKARERFAKVIDGGLAWYSQPP